jgi:hypothetical protein
VRASERKTAFNDRLANIFAIAIAAETDFATARLFAG